MLLMTEWCFRKAWVRHLLSMSGRYSADRDLEGQIHSFLPGEPPVRYLIEAPAVET
jgi:hypothetical protein